MADDHEPSGLKERILRDQTLSNERETRPEQFGGMPESPVENAENATPRAKRDTTPVEDLRKTKGRRDIQSDGN